MGIPDSRDRVAGQCLRCRCCATAIRSELSTSSAAFWSRSATSRSICSRLLPIKRSSRSKMSVCSTKQRRCWSSKPRPPEVLQIINSSPGNIEPVFDTILEKAMDLCEAAFGILFTYAGEGVHAVATRGLSTQFDDLVRAGFHTNPDSEMSRGAEVQHIAD